MGDETAVFAGEEFSEYGYEKSTTFPYDPCKTGDQMDDLTVEEILALHAGIMARDGGDNRVISEANLHEAVFHVNYQPDPFARAATVVYLLCAYKAFRDGNKRTAQAVVEKIFLDAGYIVKSEDFQCMALMQGVIDFVVETDEIETYFREMTGAG